MKFIKALLKRIFRIIQWFRKSNPLLSFYAFLGCIAIIKYCFVYIPEVTSIISSDYKVMDEYLIPPDASKETQHLAQKFKNAITIRNIANQNSILAPLRGLTDSYAEKAFMNLQMAEEGSKTNKNIQSYWYYVRLNCCDKHDEKVHIKNQAVRSLITDDSDPEFHNSEYKLNLVRTGLHELYKGRFGKANLTPWFIFQPQLYAAGMDEFMLIDSKHWDKSVEELTDTTMVAFNYFEAHQTNPPAAYAYAAEAGYQAGKLASWHSFSSIYPSKELCKMEIVSKRYNYVQKYKELFFTDTMKEAEPYVKPAIRESIIDIGNGNNYIALLHSLAESNQRYCKNNHNIDL